MVALDTPQKLKQSVPGSTVIEAKFASYPVDWDARLRELPGVQSVQVEHGSGAYRILSANGSQTVTEMTELATRSRVELKTLSVQSTTLDDVFVYYTEDNCAMSW